MKNVLRPATTWPGGDRKELSSGVGLGGGAGAGGCGGGAGSVSELGSGTVPTVPAECGDGIDNDLNGVADHPGDPGCSSPTDEDESSPAPPSSCNVADTADTCVHLTTGDLYAEQAVYRVETVVTATHTVGGYVEGYRFTVPSGGSVVVPCVRLVALSASANPCQAAGGTFVSRTATLVEDVDQPWVAYGSPLATVRVCEATVTITVAGFGAEGFPALTTC
jgi:hypothetical protein